MRQQGMKNLFDTIVAGGWRGALPHGSQRQDCCSGRVCHSDFGALYQGYCSDMTRTLMVNGEG